MRYNYINYLLVRTSRPRGMATMAWLHYWCHKFIQGQPFTNKWLLWTVARSVTTPAHQHKTQVNRFSLTKKKNVHISQVCLHGKKYFRIGKLYIYRLNSAFIIILHTYISYPILDCQKVLPQTVRGPSRPGGSCSNHPHGSSWPHGNLRATKIYDRNKYRFTHTKNLNTPI